MITITDNAYNKIHDLMIEDGAPNLVLRIFVQGGGCAGYQYGFTFDDQINDDDMQFTKNDTTVVMDMISSQYLAGAELDYKEEKFNSQFVVRNPNAVTTCGCGSSFTT